MSSITLTTRVMSHEESPKETVESTNLDSVAEEIISTLKSRGWVIISGGQIEIEGSMENRAIKKIYTGFNMQELQYKICELVKTYRRKGGSDLPKIAEQDSTCTDDVGGWSRYYLFTEKSYDEGTIPPILQNYFAKYQRDKSTISFKI